MGFHRGASADGSGVTMDMGEWGEFLECVAESVIEELNKSHPNFHDLEIRDLCMSMLYLHPGKRYNSEGTQQLPWVSTRLPVNEITWNLAV